MNEHLTYMCYINYLKTTDWNNKDLFYDIDEICEQLWAEVRIMKTLDIHDLKNISLEATNE